MYGVLYYLDKNYSLKKKSFTERDTSSLLFSEESSFVVKAGFIHVPYIPEQVKDKKEMPALPLSDIVRGLEAAIQTVEGNELDLKKAFGREC